jgi:outer membrane protein assembly factor BamB
LIAGGKVFVTTVTGLHALDASTGATLWSTGDIGTNPASAYDAGRVFVINRNGLLRAFDASTGTQVWTRQLSGQAFTSAPTAVGGTVYITGYPTLYAVSEQDGTIRWSVPNAGGDSSSPAVSSNGVYVAFSCNNTWGLSPTNGSVLWHYSTDCFGGGGRTPVLYAGRLYDRAGDDLVIHSTAGVPVATFASVEAPAFNGSTGYFKTGTTLEARDIISGTLKWSFTGDGTLSSAPIVVNGHVYVGSTSGKLYALNESTGANVWTGNVGASVLAPDEQSSSAPVGLGAGEGLIVVPASNRLVAYQSSPRLMTDSNNQVIALDSVTFVRDPFSVAGLHNFSSDQRTRITIFTTNLGINQPSGDLVVTANNSPLTVEAVGTLPAAPDISYIVVRLDPILTSDANLTVIFHGVTTNSGVLKISP